MPVCRVGGILSRRALLLQQAHGFFHFYGLVFFRLPRLIRSGRAVHAKCFCVSDMYHAVTFIKIEINSAAYVHKISAAVGNILMIDPDNMRVRQCNEPFPLQIVWFTQLSCRKLLRVRKPFRFRLQELLHTADQLLHLVQPDIFSRLVRVVIAGAEVDRGKIQMRRQNGNVAEASERCLEAKAVDMSLELPVAALIEYRVVAARAIQLHDIIDVRFDSGLRNTKA